MSEVTYVFGSAVISEYCLLGARFQNGWYYNNTHGTGRGYFLVPVIVQKISFQLITLGMSVDYVYIKTSGLECFVLRKAVLRHVKQLCLHVHSWVWCCAMDVHVHCVCFILIPMYYTFSFASLDGCLFSSFRNIEPFVSVAHSTSFACYR